MTDAAGRALGSRYELVDRIGQGASGVVWRAWDRREGKPVAAKLLWPHYVHDQEVLTRFIKERTILMSLHHPHIINVTDLVVEGEDLGIIMDLVQGPSLSQVLRQSGTLPAGIAVAYMIAVLDGLGYAHDKGVLHRDVKPDNILLATVDRGGPEDIRVADFGIARLTHDTVARTETIGTPYYMAPEVISYGKSGPASDVYAAGVVLYELLAGRTPFAGPGTNVTVSLRHISDMPPRLGIPDPLHDVLDTMLAKDPAIRGSASEAANALRAIPASELADIVLPVQPEPDQWDPSPEILPDKQAVEAALGLAASGVEAASGDTTSLRARQPLHQTGADKAVEPVSDAVDPAGLTQVRAAPVHDNTAPVAQPDKPRRTWLIVGIGAGVVVVVTVMILWLTGVFGRGRVDDEHPPVTTTPGHVTGDTLPTGLRIDLDAAWDGAQDATALTVTLSATPTSAISGGILIDIPPLADTSSCPVVTAAEPVIVRHLTASEDGFTGVCAHELTGIHLDAGATMSVALAVDLDLFALDGQPPADYSGWLHSITQTTSQDLSAITGSSYPLQRVNGLSVVVDSVTLSEVDGTPVPYSVQARWLGEGGSDPVFSSTTITGMETELLHSLTGGAGLSGVSIDVCDATAKTGIAILARQPTSSCDIQIRVGSLVTSPASFRIIMR